MPCLHTLFTAIIPICNSHLPSAPHTAALLTLDHRLVGHPVADLEGEGGGGGGACLAVRDSWHLLRGQRVFDDAILTSGAQKCQREEACEGHGGGGRKVSVRGAVICRNCVESMVFKSLSSVTYREHSICTSHEKVHLRWLPDSTTRIMPFS